MDSLNITKESTVLIVDDTVFNLQLLADLLKPHYRVKLATNGEAALRIAQGDDPPDLIVLDIMMPGMSGYDVCRQLQLYPITSDIPVIFLSAMNESEDEEFGMLIGAIDYITKPFESEALLERVAHSLKNRLASNSLPG